MLPAAAGPSSKARDERETAEPGTAWRGGTWQGRGAPDPADPALRTAATADQHADAFGGVRLVAQAASQPGGQAPRHLTRGAPFWLPCKDLAARMAPVTIGDALCFGARLVSLRLLNV